MVVLLFDIDGTLLDTRGAGGKAVREAWREVCGVPIEHELDLRGCTDRGIARTLFELHAIENEAEVWRAFAAAYLRRLPQALAENQGRLLAGVREGLAALSARADISLGLLTGNMRAGAEIKLRHFALDHYFAFGGFGDDHEDRNLVAAAALRAAETHHRREVDPANVWVIGDTPRDVACARAISARVLAVATGGYPAAELAPHQPDLLAEDLSDLPELLTRMGL